MGNSVQANSDSNIESQQGQSQQTNPFPTTHKKLAKSKYITQPNVQNASDTISGYLELVQSVNSQQQYKRWKKQISQYTLLPSNASQLQPLLLPDLIEYEKQGLCGTSGLVKSRYPVLPFLLKEEITNRAEIKQPFLQKELWYLLYVLCFAGKAVHQKGLILGDVRPDNVLMSNEGQIFVCCLATFLNQQTNYTKSLTLQQSTYLSPEQVADIQSHHVDQTAQPQQSQCFSIGLTVLTALLLQPLEKLYSSDFVYNFAYLQTKLKTLRQQTQYSQNLRGIIEALLKIDTKERATCGQVVALLNKYQEDIVNLEDFDIQWGDQNRELKTKLEKNRGNDYKKVINSIDLNKNSRIQYTLNPIVSPIISPRVSRVVYQQVVNPNAQHNSQPLNISSLPPQKNELPFFRSEKNPNATLQVFPNFILQSQYHQPQIFMKKDPPPIVITESLYTTRNISNPENREAQGFVQHLGVDSFHGNGQPVSVKQGKRNQIPSSFVTAGPDVLSYISHTSDPNAQENERIRMQAKQSTKQTLTIQPNFQSFKQVESFIQPNKIPTSPLIQQYSPQQPYATQLSFQPSGYPPNKAPFPQIAKDKGVSSLTNTIRSTIEQNEKKFSSLPKPAYAVESGAVNLQNGNMVMNESMAGSKERDRVFEIYEQAMKNIDEKLQESKRMFPDEG